MKVKLTLIVLALAVSCASVFTVRAQDFPWKDFERRTLKEIATLNETEDVEDRKRLPDQNRLIARGKILPSVVRATYTGKSRPIDEKRRKFIELWAGSYFSQSPGYAANYESEFLFKEGADEYWLPVQKQVASHFPKELQQDDAIDLYLIRPGGISDKGKPTDWIFLVEEFQKVAQSGVPALEIIEGGLL